MAQKVKKLPAMQEHQVQSLGWEEPLDKEIATHSSVAGLQNPGIGLQPMGLAKSWTQLGNQHELTDLTDLKNKPMVTKGESCRGRDKLRSWD